MTTPLLSNARNRRRALALIVWVVLGIVVPIVAVAPFGHAGGFFIQSAFFVGISGGVIHAAALPEEAIASRDRAIGIVLVAALAAISGLIGAAFLWREPISRVVGSGLPVFCMLL